MMKISHSVSQSRANACRYRADRAAKNEIFLTELLRASAVNGDERIKIKPNQHLLTSTVYSFLQFYSDKHQYLVDQLVQA